MKHLQRNVLAMAVFGITLAWSGVVTAAEEAKTTAPPLGGGLCLYGTGSFAQLDTTQFAGCVKLRKDEGGKSAIEAPVVFALTGRSMFATTCPVTVVKINPPHGGCTNVAKEALEDGDVVRIDEWGPTELELSIQRPSGQVFHSTQGRVILEPAKIMLEGKPHTVGFHARAMVNADESATPAAVPVDYYVYLRNVVQGGRHIRWYEVEVFDETADCQAEIPGTSTAASEAVDCEVTEVHAPGPYLRTTKQMPSGGGGEPPPRPR